MFAAPPAPIDDAFLAALLARDFATLSALVGELRADGSSVDSIYTDVFAPALRRVGELWASGEISVATEHVASALIEQLMGSLYGELSPTTRVFRERVVVAGPAGERHAIGMRMAADILQGHGFDVVFVGVDTPRGDFPDMLRRYDPPVILLAAYLPDTCAELVAVAREALDRSPDLRVIAGGAADLIRQALADEDRIEAVENIGEALAAVERAVAGRASL